MMRIGGNVYGIKPFTLNEKLGVTAIKCWYIQAGPFILIETNVEWHRYEYREKAESTFKLEFGAAKADFRTSSEIFENAHYKPGGTVTIDLGPWLHTIVESRGGPT
jgi:hypothetical protein